MGISNINWELVGKKLTNEITDNENHEFEEWLNSSVDNQLLFQKIISIWEKSIAGNRFQGVDIEAGLLAVKKEIDARKYASLIELEKPSTTRSLNIRKALRIAASIVIIFGIGFSGSFYLTSLSNSNTGTFAYNTPNGSKSSIILPDSTRIWLNSGSDLSYDADFSKNRKVRLNGEAYFDVRRNPKKPFVVETSNLNITVLGTAFNVSSYENDNTIETTLVRGAVSIAGKNSTRVSKSVLLEPKQKLTYLKDSKKMIISRDVNTELYTAWKDNKLIFENEAMNDLKIILERWYGMDIQFLEPELGNYHYTGTIENETIYQVLEILKITMPIKYEIKHRQVIIGLDIKD